MRRITEKIWDNARIELVDELIAEGLVDHLDIPGVETTGRQRYYDSVVLNRTAFRDPAVPRRSGDRTRRVFDSVIMMRQLGLIG
jgi:hypothetical protein